MKLLLSLVTLPLIAGCFISCTSLSPHDHPRTPAQYSTLYNDELAATDLTLEQLVDVLQKNNFSKISDLTKHLSKTHTDYMSRYTLVHNSKSLHESSPQFPRAIVYGKSAKTILTFNGHPKQRAYDKLELMRFDDDKKVFQFFEITFNEANLPGIPPYRISSEGGPDQVCLKCHLNRQPLWNHYAVWPGVFGAEDDFPVYSGDGNENGRNGFLSILKSSRKTVVEEWLNLKNKTLKTGRYSHLPPQAISKLDEKSKHPRPNAELTIALYKRNLSRISRILENLKASQDPAQSFLVYGQYCGQANSLLQKDHELGAVAKVLERNRSSFNQKSTEKAREVFLNDIKEIARHYKINWKELEKQINHLPEEKQDLWEVGQSANEDEFYLKFLDAFSLGSETIKSFYRFPSKHLVDTEDQGRFLFSILQKYFPQAQVHTWPLNFHGFYIFEDGISSELDLKNTINMAFDSNLQKEYKNLSEDLETGSAELNAAQKNKVMDCRRLLLKIQKFYFSGK